MEGMFKRNEIESLTGPELQNAFAILLKKGRTEDVKLLKKLTLLRQLFKGRTIFF